VGDAQCGSFLKGKGGESTLVEKEKRDLTIFRITGGLKQRKVPLDIKHFVDCCSGDKSIYARKRREKVL